MHMGWPSPQMTPSEFELSLSYIYVFSPPCFLVFYTIPPSSGTSESFQSLIPLNQSRCCFCGAILLGSVYLMVLIKN